MDKEVLVNCSNDDLADTFGQLHGISCAAHRYLLSILAELDRRESFRDDGAIDAATWVAAKLSVSPETARAWTEVARALEDLPAIGDAFAAGTLSFDQIRAVTQFATPETDAELAEAAPKYSVAQLKEMARRERARSQDAVDVNFDRRALSWWWERDHTVMRLSGRLPSDQGAVVEAALTRVIDRFSPNPAGVYDEHTARAADTLVELASQRLDVDFDADRATVVAHVDASVLAGGEGVAEFDSGAVLATETARRLACDARLQTVVHNSDATPLGIGRVSRTVPPWLVRQLRYRDRTCCFPGCSRTRHMHSHHIKHWGKNGPTDLTNLALLCWYHHRLVHEGGWTLRGDPTYKLEFLRPDGSVFEAGPPAIRPEVRRRLFPEEDDKDGSGEAAAC